MGHPRRRWNRHTLLLLEDGSKKFGQFMKSAFGLRWVEHGIIGNGPAVSRALVGLALIFASPRGKGLLEVLNGLCIHALVVGRVAKVEPRFDSWEHPMRAGGIVRLIEAAAME